MKYPSGAPKDYEDLLQIHGGLINKIVLQFHNEFPDHLEWDEKKSYVVMAFMRCMKMFKPELGWKFSSYAGHAARHELWKAIKDEIRFTLPGTRKVPGSYGYRVEHWDFLDGTPEGSSPSDLNKDQDRRLYKARQFHKDSPENIVALRERVEYIRNTLPEKYRPVFDLMLEGFTQAEACEAAQLVERRQAWNNAYRKRLKAMRKEFDND